MVTIFASPKAFRGHFAVIQENAIASWSKLWPKCEIILMGNELGVAKIAKKYHAIHLPDIKTNSHGTPELDELFSQAKKHSRKKIIAYVNSDIILLDDFLDAINLVKLPSYLMVGNRWDLEIKRKITFNSHWKEKIKQQIFDKGELKYRRAVDYFIFPKKTDLKVLPLAIGRGVWDNWLLYQAKKLKIPLIDASEIITAAHQIHDYSHAGGYEKVWLGVEHERNSELAKDRRRPITLASADYILTPIGLVKQKIALNNVWRILQVYPTINKYRGLFLWPFIVLIEVFISNYFRISKFLPARVKISKGDSGNAKS